MRKLALLSIGTLFGVAALSKSPLDCLDPDVLRGLLMYPGQGEQVTAVYGTTMPPELAAFKAPRQLTWIGSAEQASKLQLQGNTVALTRILAAYRTNLSPEAATAAVVGALNASGWTLQTEQRFGSPGVFASGSSSPVNQAYCREGKPLNVNANVINGVTYVGLTLSRGADNPGAGLSTVCNPVPRPVPRVGAMEKYLPKLEPPRDPENGQPAQMRSSGGTWNDARFSTGASLTLKDSVANVASHFARQMTAQGWTADASWSGTGTAGSTWVKHPDADTALQATLSVAALDEARFAVSFHIIRSK